MNFRNFLKTKIIFLVGLTSALLVVCVVFKTCGISRDVIAITCLGLVVLAIVSIVAEYRKIIPFCKSLEKATKQEELNLDVMSVIASPKDAFQESIVEVVRSIDQAANLQVTQAKEFMADYEDFIEAWVHEIKTPLAASMLVANRLDLNTKHELIYQFEMMNREIDQVLWYARSNSVNGDYRIRKLYLKALISNVCKKHARYLIEKNVALNILFDDSVFVFTDEKWSSFIISQVVINSAKYGAKTIKFVCEVAGDESFKKRICLSISDDGYGIPAEDLPYVFNRAFVGKRGRESGQSTGMGLYLASKMCKQLNLGIFISSKEEIGTTVRLEFPYDDTLLQFCNKNVT